MIDELTGKTLLAAADLIELRGPAKGNLISHPDWFRKIYFHSNVAAIVQTLDPERFTYCAVGAINKALGVSDENMATALNQGITESLYTRSEVITFGRWLIENGHVDHLRLSQGQPWDAESKLHCERAVWVYNDRYPEQIVARLREAGSLAGTE